MPTFDNKIRQIALLIFILGLSILLIKELVVFLPGFLGALTIYILSRDWYYKLTAEKGWKKSLTALLFLVGFVVLIGIPLFFTVRLVFSKIEMVMNNSDDIVQVFQSVVTKVNEWAGSEMLSAKNLEELPKILTTMLPKVLNSGAGMVGNFLMLLFLYFFMLVGGRQVEAVLARHIPLKRQNVIILAEETKTMVKANAIGIPLISIIQGCFAILGYWIFGVKEVVLWGFLTAIFAFFPVVGTALIWIPLVVNLFSTGHDAQGIGLAIYSLVVTGNVDYLARITLLKKIGDVHPVVAVLGLIVGLKLLGFWGFIFGPLLISYFLLLVRIYVNEFGSTADKKEVIV